MSSEFFFIFGRHTFCDIIIASVKDGHKYLIFTVFKFFGIKILRLLQNLVENKNFYNLYINVFSK